MASNNFYLFPNLLDGCKKLEKCLEKCIELKRDYVEKSKKSTQNNVCLPFSKDLLNNSRSL